MRKDDPSVIVALNHLEQQSEEVTTGKPRLVDNVSLRHLISFRTDRKNRQENFRESR